MSDVGYATLQIIPSAKGFSSNLGKEIEGPLAQSGQAAGEKAGGSFAKSFGKVAVAGLAVGAAAVGAFATKSANTFATVGGEVSKLSRYTGLAAEEASRLRFAGKQAGIGVDDMTSSLGILSKNIAGTKLDKLGFGFKDVHGKAKPLREDLLKIADRFEKLPNGVEKNALAMQLFGKSGAQLIPFLNKGSKGIAELEKQSDKLGSTLSGKDLDAVKASTAAHRLFDAAMEGLQIQVGQYVLPIFTKFVTFATSTLMPAIGAVSDLTQKYLAPAFDFAFGVIDTVMGKTVNFVSTVLVPGIKDGIARIVEAVTPFATKVRDAFEKARAAVDDKLTPALRDRLMPVLHDIASFISDHLAGALAIAGGGTLALALQATDVASALGGVIQTIALLPNILVIGVVAIAALVAGFIYAYKHSEKFKETVDHVAAVLKDKLAKAVDIAKDLWPKFLEGIREVAQFFKTDILPVLRKVADFLVNRVAPIVAEFVKFVLDAFGDLVGWVKTNWPQISEAIGHVIETIKVIVTVAINIISAIWRAWGDDLFHLAEKMFGHIRETIENVINIIAGVIKFVLAIINGDWGKAWDALKGVISAVWDEIKNTIGAALDLVKAVIGGALSLIAQVWNGAWDLLSGAVSGVFDTVVGFVTGLPKRIADAASGLWDGLTSGLSGIVDTAIKLINDLIRAANHLPGVNIALIGGDGAKGSVGGNLGTAGQAAVLLLGKDTKHGPNAGARGLASGGFVKARPGGVFANIAERGDDEAVIPLSPQGLNPLASALAPLLGGGSGMAVDVTVGIDPTGGESAFMSWLIKALRLNGAFRRDVKTAVAA